MVNRVRLIRSNRVHWIHIVSPTEDDIQFLRDNFQFHPLDLQDCINIAQRPKIESYDAYVFLILLFPYYVRHEKEIRPAEIDFFIGPDYLITVSDGKHPVLDQFFDDCLKSNIMRERYLDQTPAHLLYETLRRLQESVFPMLDHMSEDIGNIEHNIFSGHEKQMVGKILLIKRNIVNFRRIVNAHKSTLKKLVGVSIPGVFVLHPGLALYFGNIIDRTKDIWEILEILKETINAFQEANDSLISFKLNDAMRVLTAISVSILPATLVATIFGMNALGMPLVLHPYGFWILVVGMGLLVTGILAYFKKRNWL
ncbi:MAG: hypothetical protein A3B30_03805 [Candidatus Komeilibacteria bacterium RIFCSPLOWO2_01_FULL_52_15]|uniref:Magnesium transporter n=2 Tax=Candidatus Komeiliibacteriota TaxID=1817908 RepID=A0A1G2BR17_9BACT|nr:MAG: hypothetical protein A2677_03765 [Candidatus Komeilibacteria bacterium RIFCSPHIGHO2_01_FULL_52_14]OGY91572.1 MAG: hypothetical protein A3B30_03805 [Candidatus Komeilibacteria bacterium RIFCSPLOWO2_01_FULL_52_15]